MSTRKLRKHTNRFVNAYDANLTLCDAVGTSTSARSYGNACTDQASLHIKFNQIRACVKADMPGTFSHARKSPSPYENRVADYFRAEPVPAGLLSTCYEHYWVSVPQWGVSESRWLSNEISNESSKWNEFASKLEVFEGLGAGWDGYNAPAPTKRVVSVSKKFIGILQSRDFFPTRVNPTVVGGVAITFLEGSRKAYVEFLNGNIALLLLKKAENEPSITEFEFSYLQLVELADNAWAFINA